MSVRVMAAVWESDLAPTEKLVLLALADCANDEGRCWPSATTLARKTGQGERTIRRAIQALIEGRHLTQDQRSGTSPIYTVHPCQSGTPARAAPLPHRPEPMPERHPTPARAAPKPSKNRKRTVTHTVRAHELPADWEPQDFSVGSESRKVVDGWPPGEFPAQLEAFRAHHGKKGDRFIDWQKAWSTWVLNTRRFGIGRNERSSNPTGTALARVQAAIRCEQPFG